MHRILIADDNKTITRLVKRKIVSELGFEVHEAACLADVKHLLEENEDYFMAVLDLNLPDAPNGEVVDYVSAKKIPSIILTGTFDESVRRKMYSKHIIDYLIKEGSKDLDSIIKSMKRLMSNRGTKILVVDDSSTVRQLLVRLLERQYFTVLQATDGQEGVEIVTEHPDIKLVITDYNMPRMGGVELISEIRRNHGKDSIAIIGLSSSEDDSLTAKFLKSGANDFLAKTFSIEEFYCRVWQNIELIDLFWKIKDASNKDFLTKLYNRRYFFENGIELYKKALAENEAFACAMMDIDHFKKINDTYGHDGGDMALVYVSQLLMRSFRKEDIVARMGGEEFCVLLGPIDAEEAKIRLECLRTAIENSKVPFGDLTIQMTISIGLVTEPCNSLEGMMKSADELLYQAKTNGRNRIEVS